MLQNPKTKFSYARRVLALPVLFSVVFAFLVNAKNRETKIENTLIQNEISKLKKDTIKPNKITDNQSTKNFELNKSYNQKPAEISAPAISEKLENAVATKTSEKAAPASKTDSLLAKFNNEKTDKLSSTDSREADRYFENIKSNAVDVQKFFNSKELKKFTEESKAFAEKTKKWVQSEEFKKSIAEANKTAADASKFTNSEEFKKMINDIKNTSHQAATAEALALAAEARKRAAEALTSAKEEANMLIISGNKVYTVRGNNFTSKGVTEDDYNSIMINGKPATKEELNALKKDDMKHININSDTRNGKNYRSIQVTTK